MKIQKENSLINQLGKKIILLEQEKEVLEDKIRKMQINMDVLREGAKAYQDDFLACLNDKTELEDKIQKIKRLVEAPPNPKSYWTDKKEYREFCMTEYIIDYNRWIKKLCEAAK